MNFATSFIPIKLERSEPGTPLRERPAAPGETIARVVDLLEVEAEGVRLWMFGRAAAGPGDTWNEEAMTLARALA